AAAQPARALQRGAAARALGQRAGDDVAAGGRQVGGGGPDPLAAVELVVDRRHAGVDPRRVEGGGLLAEAERERAFALAAEVDRAGLAVAALGPAVLGQFVERAAEVRGGRVGSLVGFFREVGADLVGRWGGVGRERN